jgi:hypothetical protein
MRRLASDRQRANLALFADLLHLANSAIFRAKGRCVRGEAFVPDAASGDGSHWGIGQLGWQGTSQSLNTAMSPMPWRHSCAPMCESDRRAIRHSGGCPRRDALAQSAKIGYRSAVQFWTVWRYKLGVVDRRPVGQRR